jgi:ABC-type taurine transport system ATPase subunit
MLFTLKLMPWREVIQNFSFFMQQKAVLDKQR